MAVKTITEAEYERIADARVQHRLATDPAYRNAEDAEAQSKAEAEIEWQVKREMTAEGYRTP